MPTIREINERTNQLLDSWEKKFTPLLTAVTEVRGDMAERIFGDREGKKTGSTPSKNAQGDTLPTTPYSTKELYISTDAVPRASNSFKVGKRGKKINSLYFPQGYSQLKKSIDRGALQLTENLKKAFTNKTAIVTEGSNVRLEIPIQEEGKVDGLEKRYGKIFIMSEEEIKNFEEILSELIIEAINKAID